MLGTIQGGNQGSGLRDKLSYANYNSGVSIDLHTRVAPGIFTFNGIEEIQAPVGFSNELLGPDATTTWTIDGLDTGLVGTVRFAGFGKLIGGLLNDAFTLSTSGGVSQSIDGSDGTDTIVGPNADRTWTIAGVNEGSISSSVPQFLAIENLTGGSAVDSFAFVTGGALTGTLNAGLGLTS